MPCNCNVPVLQIQERYIIDPAIQWVIRRDRKGKPIVCICPICGELYYFDEDED